MQFHEQQALRFSCTQCGACCVAGTEYYVFLEPGEPERIRRHLGVSKPWFSRRYIERQEDDELVLASEPDGRCVFLKGNGHCRVYPVRPLQCRTYPFWPENVASRIDWFEEAKRCEGINQGQIVPVGRIRQLLRKL